MRDPQIRNIFACEISSEFSGTSYDDNESVLHFANRKLFELFVRSLCVKSALVKRLCRLFKRTNSSNSFSCALRNKGIIYNINIIYYKSNLRSHTETVQLFVRSPCRKKCLFQRSYRPFKRTNSSNSFFKCV